VIVVFWSCSDVLEAFLRFWLICHTSDQIRETVIILFRIFFKLIHIHLTAFNCLILK
jgi:hypothetical protein